MAAMEKLRVLKTKVPCVFCLTFSSSTYKAEDDHDFLLRSKLSKIFMEKWEEKSGTDDVDFEGVEPWEGLILCYPCKETIFSIRALQGQVVAMQQRMTYLAQSLVDKIQWSKETHKIIPITVTKLDEGNNTRKLIDQGLSIDGPSTVHKIKKFYRGDSQEQEKFFQNWIFYRDFLSKVKNKKERNEEKKSARLSVPTASALVKPKIAFENKRGPESGGSNKVSFSYISDSLLKKNQSLSVAAMSAVPTASASCSSTLVPANSSSGAARRLVAVVPQKPVVRNLESPAASNNNISKPAPSVSIDDLSNSASKNNGKVFPALPSLRTRPSVMSAAQMMSAAVTKRSGNPPSQLNVARYTPRTKAAECVSSKEIRNRLKAKEKEMRENPEETIQKTQTTKTNKQKRKSTIVCREDWSSTSSDNTNEEYSSDSSGLSDNSGSKKKRKSNSDPVHPTFEVILPATSEDGIDSCDEEEELPHEDPLAGTDPLKDESADYIEDLEEQSEEDDPSGLRVEVKEEEEEEIIVKLEPEDYA